MKHLDLIKITTLMGRTSGSPDLRIGLIDGPVAQHAEFAGESLLKVREAGGAVCRGADDAACLHGTFVAGILSAKRGSAAPAICPGCTLLLRPIFTETMSGDDAAPSATPEALAAAIVDCIAAGANVINLSLGLAQPSLKAEQALEDAFDQALRRGVLVIAAAGNQGALGSSAIIRHPWVLPVVACGPTGRPVDQSNLGASIGKRGLCAPGHGVTSLGVDGIPLTLGGTSVAVPFVTGAIALLWSEFPAATAADIKLAVTRGSAPRRSSVVPPLLDAEDAYRNLSIARVWRAAG